MTIIFGMIAVWLYAVVMIGTFLLGLFAIVTIVCIAIGIGLLIRKLMNND